MQDEVQESVIVVTRGDVPGDMVAYGRRKLLAAISTAPVPLLDLELRIDHHSDPARAAANHVEMTADVNGAIVRSRATAPTITEAVDDAADRLRRRVVAANDRRQHTAMRHRNTPRIYAQRPRDTRALSRRKTFALAPESLEAALFDLEALDHDFFLFVHDETGAEAVVYRTDDDGYGLMQRVATPDAIAALGIEVNLGPPPAVSNVDDALTVLDALHVPFEFFVDSESGRGVVAYRRYDGHYGLILPT